MTLKANHFTFTVREIDESIKWYKEKLGLEVITRYEWNGLQIAHLELGDLRLELFDNGKDTLPLPDYRKELMSDLSVIGVKHLCLETDNLEKSVDELKEKGVEFIQEISKAGFGGRKTFFKDCNGIIIELYQK